MNYIFVIPSIQSAKAFFIPLFEALLSEGNSLSLVTNTSYENAHFEWNTDIPKEVTIIHHDIPRIPIPHKINSAKALILSLVGEFKTQIHGHFLVGSLIVSSLPSNKSFFKATFLHGLVENDFSFLKRILIKSIERRIAKNSDALWLFNQTDFNRLKMYNSVKLLPGFGMGVDETRFLSIEEFKSKRNVFREELGIPTDALVFLFVGRLIKTKGIDEIVKGFTEAQKTSQNIHLILVGESDPAHANISLKAHYGITQVGWQTQLERFFAMADVYITASHREAIAVGIMEAMYCGLPILAPPTKGIIELVNHEIEGYIMANISEKEVEKGIKFFIQNRQRIATLSANVLKKRKLYLRSKSVSVLKNEFSNVLR